MLAELFKDIFGGFHYIMFIGKTFKSTMQANLQQNCIDLLNI